MLDGENQSRQESGTVWVGLASNPNLITAADSYKLFLGCDIVINKIFFIYLFLLRLRKQRIIIMKKKVAIVCTIHTRMQ